MNHIHVDDIGPYFHLLSTFIIFREDTEFNLSAGNPEIAETSEKSSMDGIKNEILHSNR